MQHDHSRFIDLQGCINFRDLGGHRTRDGQTVKWRRLFRSDSVHLMSPQDIDHVYSTLSVVTLVDLRSTAEVQRDGTNVTHSASVNYHHVSFLEQHEIMPFDPEDDPADRYTETYLWILSNSGTMVAGVLSTLAQERNLPAVFHFSAGKDRTGVLAALILGVLGVDDDRILADYMLTNQTMDLLYERLRAIPGNEQRPRAFFEAQPRAMEATLKALNTTHGGAEEYARAHGVTQNDLAQLRESLLE